MLCRAAGRALVPARWTALSTLRCTDEHEALVEALQHELASDLLPPADSHDWPDLLLRRWFTAGGAITVRAVAETPWCAATRRLVADLGSEWPVAELEPMPQVGAHSTVLEAMRHDDAPTLAAVAERIAERDAVALRLGIDDTVIEELLSEGERAWDAMRPGELRAEDGTIVSGQSPSGAARGDKFVFASTLLAPEAGGPQAWPALASVDDALGRVGAALSSHFEPLGLPPLSPRASSLLACFPGDGVGYGSHLDGGEDEGASLTAIFYTARAWRPEHGGRLHMLDEARHCWWALPPRADTLVLFRSDRVLHKVEPAFAPRFALTKFFVRRISVADERDALISNLSGL